jgi:hypothetical protein
MRVTCPAHLIILGLITLIIFDEAFKFEAPHYAVFCNLLPLSPSWINIFLLSTLLSNVLCVLRVRDKVSDPYKTSGKIIFLRILIFTVL